MSNVPSRLVPLLLLASCVAPAPERAGDDPDEDEAGHDPASTTRVGSGRTDAAARATHSGPASADARDEPRPGQDAAPPDATPAEASSGPDAANTVSRPDASPEDATTSSASSLAEAAAVPYGPFVGRPTGVVAPPGELKLVSVDHNSSLKGKTSVNGLKLEVTGYGREYAHHYSDDEGRFVYVELEGDFDVAVQIEAMRGHNVYHPPRAGIMAREIESDPAKEDSARYVAVWASGNGVNEGTNDAKNEHPIDKYLFDHRSALGGSIRAGNFKYHHVNRQKTDINKRDFPHVWLRLRREGNRFYGMFGKDGVNWTFMSKGFWDTSFKPKLRVGVAMASSPGDPRGRMRSSTVVFMNLSGL
jgi:hypothetical protein